MPRISRIPVGGGAIATEKGYRPRSVIPPSGISRWEFEQDVADSWGNNGGTNNGATFVTDSQIGSYSLEFDGTDDYVAVTNSNLDRGSSESWSIATWLKSTSTEQGWIVAFRGSNALTIIDLNNTGDDIRFYARDDSSNTLQFTPAVTEISDGTWHMYTMVYDDANGLYAYIDDATQLGSDTSATLGAFTYDSSTRFNNDSTDGTVWPGKMDDPRYYSKDLSTSEISDLYNTGSI